MKGLKLVFGLVPALFLSSVNASTIYDTATSLPPKIKDESIGHCDVYTGWGTDLMNVSYDDCVRYSKDRMNDSLSPPYQDEACHANPGQHASQYKFRTFLSGKNTYMVRDHIVCVSGGVIKTDNIAIFRPFAVSQPKEECPPDGSPSYVIHGTKSDGQNACFEPNELDKASKCYQQSQMNNILPAGSGLAPSQVCAPVSNGGRCAYSLVNIGNSNYYQPDPELNCFLTPLPDYEPAPSLPDGIPGVCKPYHDSIFVCQADPSLECKNGVCTPGCGFVNNEFVCFRDDDCVGDSCSPPKVDCTTNPNAPICDTPTQTECEKNPELPACNTENPTPDQCEANPSLPACKPSGGGDGGSSFKLDYQTLLDGMKDASKLLIDEADMPDEKDVSSSWEKAQEALTSNVSTIKDDGLWEKFRTATQESIFDSIKG
ncbi:MAG: hypothetical protein LPH21_19295, partial [Shewanella sp.]|nr:hypothetical protein [Shewanella sp.]